MNLTDFGRLTATKAVGELRCRTAAYENASGRSFFLSGGLRLAHCGSATWSGSSVQSNGRWLDVGAPRPHAPPAGRASPAPEYGAGMPGFSGYSECAKIAKNLSPFMAADFSLFCHGFRPRGPSRPPHPFALAVALRSATWSGGFYTEMVCLKSSRFLNFFEIFIKFFIGYDHSP